MGYDLNKLPLKMRKHAMNHIVQHGSTTWVEPNVLPEWIPAPSVLPSRFTSRSVPNEWSQESEPNMQQWVNPEHEELEQVIDTTLNAAELKMHWPNLTQGT